MKLRVALAACAVLLICSLQCIPYTFAGGKPRNQPILYEISLEHPEEHLFHVMMKVPDVTGELTVQMPAWNALYQIRDFSSHVQQVEAHAGTERVPIEKIDKQTWKIRGSGTIRIDYATYWDEPGPFATQLNGEHAFINPAMILLYVPERTEDKVLLSVGDFPNDWRAASALKLDCGPVLGKQFCTSVKTTYDAIVDAPVEIGKFKEFNVPGVPADIRAVVDGENWSQKKIERDLSRICNYELKLMDGAPFEDYVFILHTGKGAGGGGMEHANSTAIGIPSDDYLAGVAAHEFFHLWNVKRIRPASLEPVDFTKEQYTRALWFAEGVTSTYGAYTLVRSGLWSKERFYDDLGEQISELESRPANHWQSAEQSSLDAWLEKYPIYNGPEYSVSYYTKGQMLGDLLDILIRDRTDNQKSLDDVLRGMNTDFAKQGKTYRDSLDIRLAAEKVAGGSFEEFFRDYVAGAEPLPYQQVLALAGLELHTTEEKRPVLGFSPQREPGGAFTVRGVDPGSPAQGAGLQLGDVIVSWNGGDVPRFLRRWVRERHPGETLKLRIRRDEKDQELDFKLGVEKEPLYQIGEDPNAGEKARHIREGLLHGVTQAVTVR
ncbi:MAG: M61 family metallopeptidase [Candidatus Acidiferrales bacterium]